MASQSPECCGHQRGGWDTLNRQNRETVGRCLNRMCRRCQGNPKDGTCRCCGQSELPFGWLRRQPSWTSHRPNLFSLGPRGGWFRQYTYGTPADGINLAPERCHGMPVDLNKALEEGESLPMTLRFQNAGAATINTDVVSIRERNAPCPPAPRSLLALDCCLSWASCLRQGHGAEVICLCNNSG